MRSFTRLPSFAFLFLALVAAVRGDEPARKDALGDPLPDGALMHLGTERFRVSPYGRIVRLSPDGKLIAVAGQMTTIRLVDAANGSELRRIPLDQPNMSGMVFTPTGDALATIGFDGSIRFWDTATAKPLGRIDTKQFNLRTFTFSDDGKTLVVVPQVFNQKGVLHAYEVPGGKEVGSYEPVHTSIGGVAVSADGKALASWGQMAFTGANNQVEQLNLSQTVPAVGRGLRQGSSAHRNRPRRRVLGRLLAGR